MFIVFVVIFPIFDFDILSCFPELIASARSPENCIASPHPQQSQISPEEESLESGAHRHRLLARYLALLLQIYSAGRRGEAARNVPTQYENVTAFISPIERGHHNVCPIRIRETHLKNVLITHSQRQTRTVAFRSRDTPRDALRLHHKK